MLFCAPVGALPNLPTTTTRGVRSVPHLYVICVPERHRILSHLRCVMHALLVYLLICTLGPHWLSPVWILCTRTQTHIKMILAHPVPGKLFGELYRLARLFHVLFISNLDACDW